jgi:hypothetical protein
MATINLGSIKFKWKGTYAGGTAYTVDDVVEYNGSSYICIQASTGNLPTDTAYFEQMSSAGTNGTDGTDLGTTLTTQGDIVYRDASGLQRLGAGTSGQVLQTGGTGANPSWTDVSSKLLNQSITTNQQRINFGNRYRSHTDFFGTPAYVPVSTSSYFIIKAVVHANSNHHASGGLEFSIDGGTTYNYLQADGASLSGAAITWSSDNYYLYPHFTWTFGTDSNTMSTASTIIKYAPTTPHSITDLRIRVYGYHTNDNSAFIVLNGNDGNSSADGRVSCSTIEILEYET